MSKPEFTDLDPTVGEWLEARDPAEVAWAQQAWLDRRLAEEIDRLKRRWPARWSVQISGARLAGTPTHTTLWGLLRAELPRLGLGSPSEGERLHVADIALNLHLCARLGSALTAGCPHCGRRAGVFNQREMLAPRQSTEGELSARAVTGSDNAVLTLAPDWTHPDAVGSGRHGLAAQLTNLWDEDDPLQPSNQSSIERSVQRLIDPTWAHTRCMECGGEGWGPLFAVPVEWA